MPKATIDVNEATRLDLKSLEGGFVVLKRMSYGKRLERNSLSTQMKVSAERGSKGFDGELKMLNRQVTQLEFADCIVDHNLEDDDGNKLDFSRPMTLDVLDPKIGQEIGDKIDEMHNYDVEGN
jgi:hypothetical protein